jgi:hypothetical protein
MHNKKLDFVATYGGGRADAPNTLANGRAPISADAGSGNAAITDSMAAR